MALYKEATVEVPEKLVGFWDTATGKTLTVMIFQAGALALTVLADMIKLNPEWLGEWGTVVNFIISNLILVIIAKFGDPRIKNV